MSTKKPCGHFGADVPEKEFGDLIDGLVGDARQHLAEMRLGIQAIEFGAAHQTVDRGGALAAGIQAREQVVLPTQSDSA